MLKKETRMSVDDADPPSGPLLLLVDDEHLILEMLVEAVEEAGFNTITSGNAADAIALFEQNGAAIRASSPMSISAAASTAGSWPGWYAKIRPIFPWSTSAARAGTNGALWACPTA